MAFLFILLYLFLYLHERAQPLKWNAYWLTISCGCFFCFWRGNFITTILLTLFRHWISPLPYCGSLGFCQRRETPQVRSESVRILIPQKYLVRSPFNLIPNRECFVKLQAFPPVFISTLSSLTLFHDLNPGGCSDSAGASFN